MVALAYFAAGNFGLLYAVVGKTVTLTWLPSGIALASVLWFGNWVWPAVALGAFWVNALSDVPLPVVLGITAGNTLETLTGAFLLKRRFGSHRSLDSLRDVFALMMAGASSALVSATVGVASLLVWNIVPIETSLRGGLMWWMGDTTGILIATPAILAWITPHHFTFAPKRIAEASVLVLTLIAAIHAVFGAKPVVDFGYYPPAFALLPFTIWASLRFGFRGATTVTIIISILALIATTRGAGPFSFGSPLSALIRWWTFSTILATSGLLLAASRAERRRAEVALEQAHRELERRVDERTRELMRTNRDLETEMAMRRRLERELIQVSEDQQRRLGQELHDGLGQHLAGIAFLAKALFEQLRDGLSPLGSAAQDIVRLVNEAIAATRSLARGLYPAMADSGGLETALEQLAAETNQRYRLPCNFANRAVGFPFDRIAAINLFRIAQEAVSNAVRHGHSEHIAIEWAAEGQTFRLSVTDDGVGFDPKTVGTASGLGLHIMRYRARMIGARFEISSAPRRGTTISVILSQLPEGANV